MHLVAGTISEANIFGVQIIRLIDDNQYLTTENHNLRSERDELREENVCLIELVLSLNMN